MDIRGNKKGKIEEAAFNSRPEDKERGRVQAQAEPQAPPPGPWGTEEPWGPRLILSRIPRL